jgi:hypothetical protein
MGAQQMLQTTEQCFKNNKFKSKPSNPVLVRTPSPKGKLSARNPSFSRVCRYSGWISVELAPPTRQTYPQAYWLMISFSSRSPWDPPYIASQHHREIKAAKSISTPITTITTTTMSLCIRGSSRGFGLIDLSIPFPMIAIPGFMIVFVIGAALYNSFREPGRI